MRIARTVILLAFLIITVCSEFASAQERPPASPALNISRITPGGEDVPAGRQITFEFSKAMVPVGRMDRTAAEIPITITPSLACEWRWLNTTTLACQLGERSALKPATKYDLTVSVDLKAEDGSRLAAPVQHSFITARPKIEYTWFEKWRSPSHPLVNLVFDGPVTPDSVAAHVFLKGENDSRYKLKVEPLYAGAEDRWRAYPEDELPLDMKVQLTVEPGIRSPSGDQAGIENRVVVEFATFPKFELLGVTCWPNPQAKAQLNADEPVEEEYYDSSFLNADSSRPGMTPLFFPVDAALDATKRCNPMNSIALTFSAPADKEEVAPHLAVEPSLTGGRTDFDPWENVYSEVSYYDPHMKGNRYYLPLPYPLKAFDSYLVRAEEGKIKDVFGRILERGASIQFATDHRPPRFHLPHQMSVMEAGVDSQLPLIVTNLKSLSAQYESLTQSGFVAKNESPIEIYPALDIAYPLPVKVREFLKQQSGVVQGTLTAASGDYKGSNWFYSQVTPFSVHVKVGHFNSLAWVTRFSNGEPVKGAKVSFFKGRVTALSERSPLGRVAETDEHGVAMLSGLKEIDPELGLINQWNRNQPQLFARVDAGSDLAIVPLIYDFSVTDSLYPSLKQKHGHIHAWGTTAQGIYRLGDTVQFKIYVRDQDLRRFVPAPRQSYNVKVIDPTGRAVFERKQIQLSEFGAFDGEIELAKGWSVGYYSFELTSSFSKRTWYPLSVLVSDFTPSPFKVTSEIIGTSFKPKDQIEVETRAALHAGGPYADAEARITALLSSSTPSFSNPAIGEFDFGSGEYISDKQLYQLESKLDEKGELTNRFNLDEIAGFVYGKVLVESAVRDDRGRYVATNRSVPYFGRDRFIGLRHRSWLLEQNKPATIEAVAVNPDGAMLPDIELKIVLQRQQVNAAKVKGAGNAYLTEYTTQWVDEDSCTINSATTPRECSLVPLHPGEYRFLGTVQDSEGRDHSTVLSRWSAGSGYVLWSTGDYYGMNLVPDKERYSIGDTAKFFVQNPFPGATALVSLERYGILKQWTHTLTQSAEVIEVPITPDLVPGFYLSVVVVSPRVEKPIEGKVDLGNPSFKQGYVEVSIVDTEKELKVAVSPARDLYKPRETVEVALSAQKFDKKAVPTEFAVAVLDESVFDLLAAGRALFDPYAGFYTLDGLDVKNFNLLKALIGRQKFEKKGANPGGGGGGEADLRSVFKFVSYWNPSLKADAQGRASFAFQLPDNLTGWRIFALAIAKGEEMGLGEASIKSNRPTEIRSALPNQVREGDSFDARFTVMNRTEQPRSIEVKIRAEGAVAQMSSVSRSISLEPYKRETVSVPVRAGRAGEITFEVSAGDERDRDAMKGSLEVLKVKAIESAATYGTTVEKQVREPIAIPSDIRSDVGELRVTLAPSVIAGVEKSFEYIRDYPYSCWEQRLVKGVMAAHYLALRSYLPPSFSWESATQVAEQMLKDAESFQAPNGGMCFYVARNEYSNPYLSAFTALGFNWLSARGLKVPEQVQAKLHSYLLELLKRDEVPEFYTKGMASSVRAVALAALAPHKKIGFEDINRFFPHLREMDLFGKAHFLQALTQVGATEEMQRQVVDVIMAQSQQSGGKVVFSESVDNSYERMLHSVPRTSCAAITGLLAARGRAPGELSEDLFFKMIRSVSEYRKGRGHWESTQESIFCLNAFVQYSEQFEKEVPQMSVSVAFDGQPLGSGKFTSVRNEPLQMGRDLNPKDPGTRADITIDKQGSGRLYYAARLNYSPQTLKSNPINSGIEVTREYSVERNGKWELLTSPFKISAGELVRVDLFLSVPAARNFVVVDDPVPGGLEPVNRDLATASVVDAKKGEFDRSYSSYWFRHDDWMQFGVAIWSFYHRELRHDSVRFYSEYLAAGNYHLSYTAQAIAPGSFAVLPLHAEEMYDPDVFGQGRPEELIIDEANK